jgi:NAD(P)-dependent dehydrogenase (short-subunit alcohol dehydrogenase family)
MRPLSGRLRPCGRTRARGELAEQAEAPVHAVGFDVTSPDAVAGRVACAEQLAGPLDILVEGKGERQWDQAAR